MGNNEEGKSSKSKKATSPAPPDQTNIHVYPDWGAMQAYYGPRVALPPYYNSAVASGHAPHPYMWGPPQPMMPPYGAPYAAVYSHGGVYAHPAVPMGSHPHGPGVPPLSPAAATTLNNETPAKSSANSDTSLVKKLKGFDGLAMSIGNSNGNAESGEHRPSESAETEGSSEGSDGNTASERKRSRDTLSSNGGDVKTETKANLPPSREVNSSFEKLLVASVTPDSVSGEAIGYIVSPGTNLELRNPSNAGVAKVSPPSSVPQGCAVLPPPEVWLQNERELKRERRKQSNRESARRSRLRKQAETEELAQRVETLTAENVALKSEISRLTEQSEKLRNENTALMKLKNSQLGNTGDTSLDNADGKRGPSTENLLSRVNNSTSTGRSKEEEGEAYERNSNSGAKLHQLLNTSPRADAVAAG